MNFKKLGKSLLTMGLVACFSLGAFACGKKDDDTIGGGGATNVDQTPTKLATVTVVVNGTTATWEAVENAVGYEYSFDNGVTFTFTTETSATVEAGKTIIVRAAGDGVNYRHGNWSNVNGGVQATQLATPTVTLNGATASWTAVANASGYAYKIGENGTESSLPSSVTSYTLQNGETLYVKAKGDGVTYSDSAWSVAVTYTAPVGPTSEKLATPEVWLEGNVATWSTVEHATAYKYRYTDVYPTIDTTTENSIVLRDGQSLWVCATSSDSYYTDSDWSEVVTFNKVALTAPLVSLTENVVSWTEVTGATGYIVYVNGTPNNVSATTLSYTLNDTATVTVVAVGDDVINTNSANSTSVSYVKPINALAVPTVTVTDRTVSWSAVSGAIGYEYSLDGGATKVNTTATSVELGYGRTIVVRAIGDGTTAVTGDWSVAKTVETPANVVNDFNSVDDIGFINYSCCVPTVTTTNTGVKVQFTGSDEVYPWLPLGVYLRKADGTNYTLAEAKAFNSITINVTVSGIEGGFDFGFAGGSLKWFVAGNNSVTITNAELQTALTVQDDGSFVLTMSNWRAGLTFEFTSITIS